MSSVVVGTAGHIDHGKSALVRALTGTDPDRLKEEKARGITIDLGFAHTEIGGTTIAFVDVPGHERFVKNMLAGVGGIDLVLLVVAADDGVMPQTREHFDICRLLGVREGIVVLTKADLVSDEERELARADVQELVAGSFLQDAPIVATSVVSGAGLDLLRETLSAAARKAGPRTVSGAARLPIDRVFSMKGFGTVVTGTLVSGAMRAGEPLVVVPGERRVSVRGVQIHGRPSAVVHAGQRAAVNIAGASVDELSRGLTLTTPGTLAATQRVDAVIDLLESAPRLKQGARVRFHHGTAEIIGRVRLAGAAPGASLAPGHSLYVRIRLEGPAALTRGDRFILRSYSPAITIGGGRVLDPAPPRSGIHRAAAAERFRRLDAATDEAISVMLDEAGAQGMPAAALVSRAGVAPEKVDALVGGLVAKGRAASLAAVLIASSALDTARRRLLAALAEHHKVQPQSDGLPREEARMRVLPRAEAAVFERLIDELAASGTLAGRDRLRLATHSPPASAEDERVRELIERRLREAGLTPPPSEGLAAEANVAVATIERIARVLQRDKRVVKVDAFWFHADALAQLKTQIVGTNQENRGGQIDVGSFKTRFGVTRKFAIPLLEYLDRERITRRTGDARVIL